MPCRIIKKPWSERAGHVARMGKSIIFYNILCENLGWGPDMCETELKWLFEKHGGAWGSVVVKALRY